MNTIAKVSNEIRQMREYFLSRRFMRHNRGVFSGLQGSAHNRSVVLMEFIPMSSAHIACSYLGNVLAKRENADMKVYVPRILSSFFERQIFKIRRLIELNAGRVYKSFGVSEIFGILPSNAQKERAKEVVKPLLEGLRTKRDVEDLKINGVWVGDLIYDSYLRSHFRPTIDIKSKEFQDFLESSIQMFVFWEDYFASHDVRAVIVSHCVYNLAMPLRIAVNNDIAAYQASASHIYRLRKGRIFAYDEFLDYHKDFYSLPLAVQKSGLAEAEDRIKRRLKGEVGVDMAYSAKSAFGASTEQRLVLKSPRRKILIATHCFFDSPHSYGKNLFPDFFEWLDFLGKMTERTDYDWYIKTHPDYRPGTMDIINGFVARYPRFTVVPSEASHHQLVAEGIDVALTVYGTIGFEYASLGIPVINASKKNPHISYNFNLHPADVDDYRKMLTHLDELNLEIKKEEIYEFYYMRHIHYSMDLFFASYVKTVEELGGSKGLLSSEVYRLWLRDYTLEKHQSLCESLNEFIESGDFRMT